MIQNLTSYERVKMFAFYDFVFVQSFQRILLNFKIHRVTKCVETTGKNSFAAIPMDQNRKESMGIATISWQWLRMDGNA